MGLSHTRKIYSNEKMNESAIHKMTLFARNVAILLKIVEIVVGQDSFPKKERLTKLTRTCSRPIEGKSIWWTLIKEHSYHLMQEGFTDFCDDNFLIDSSDQDTETDCLSHCESTGDPCKFSI